MQLKSISPVDAEARWQEEGGQWMFVDVQTEEDFGKVHCIGTINIPLFTPIAGNSFVQMQVAILFASRPMEFQCVPSCPRHVITISASSFQSDVIHVELQFRLEIKRTRKSKKSLFGCWPTGCFETAVS